MAELKHAMNWLSFPFPISLLCLGGGSRAWEVRRVGGRMLWFVLFVFNIHFTSHYLLVINSINIIESNLFCLCWLPVSVLSLSLTHAPFIIFFLSPVQLQRRGVEWLWWAPGTSQSQPPRAAYHLGMPELQICLDGDPDLLSFLWLMA